MTVATVPDEDLMERLQAGDRHALGLLFVRHVRGLRELLSRIVRDRTLAEDLVQTTFLSVLRSARRYQPHRKVAPWLNGIATNAARDSLRRTRRSTEVLRLTASDTALDQSEQPPLSEPSHRRALERAFARLPGPQRECVVLHRLDHLSFAQIAGQLGISETAARLRAHRGYRQLRLLLVEHVEATR